jgi:hypothetical protein
VKTPHWERSGEKTWERSGENPDNQGFHHFSPKFSNSPDDSPDQALKRIKI